MKIFVGTTNQYKLREFSLTAPLYSRYFQPMPEVNSIEEYGDSFEENALIKAKGYKKMLLSSQHDIQNIVIAEDSGIVVPHFKGLPGIYSARFSGLKIDNDYNIISANNEVVGDRDEIDAKNNQRLANMILGTGKNELEAEFVCAMSAISTASDKIISEVIETLPGKVIVDYKGKSGFGYDPIFVPHNSHDKTFAELDFYRKNLRSHRRLACRKLFIDIENFYEKLNDKSLRIVLEGNDGSGKSTVKKYLEMLGYTNVLDRGEITTKFLDEETNHDRRIFPSKDTLYIILDVTPYTSQKRIANRKTDNDVTKKYHTLTDLTYWRSKYLEIEKEYPDICKVVDSSQSIQNIFAMIDIAITQFKLKYS